MKKIIIAIIFTLFITAVSAKSFIDEVIDITGTSPDVNINLGTGILRTILALSGDDDAKEVRKIMKGLDKIRISVFEFDDNKNHAKLRKALTSKIKKLKSKGYESIVTVKDKDETVHIMAKVKDQFLNDAMIVVLEADEMVIISMDGLLDLKQLVQISNHFDVELADVL